MEAVLPIVVQVLAMIPSLVSAGVSIVGLVETTVHALNSGSNDPTSDQWQAVNDLIAANTAKINTDPT